MRETEFIKQNKEKWKEFEQTLDGKSQDPEKLNDLFIQITDDLSYSRTYYPNRSVRVYLNGLAQRIFFVLYKNRKSHQNRLVSFWTDELPQLVYESGKAFRLSTFIFLLSMLIGALSCANDPDFATLILGEDYVRQTLDNIAQGDPMAIYKAKGKFGMFLGITINNLWVAFLTFAMGVFYTVGSIIVLISNGIMVGVFQYFFIEQGLFWESFLTIWIHGTLEISAIIIAGAAGITMGQGLVFPGTYTRRQSFQQSARRGMKIMVGITPIIILAGFFEGFLTRFTDTPDVVRGLFILICLLFVLGYFVWYPRMRARLGFSSNRSNYQIPADKVSPIDYSAIKTSAEIYAEIFIVYKDHFKAVGKTAFFSALLFLAVVFPMASVKPSELFVFEYGLFQTFFTLQQFFVNEDWAYLSLVTLFTLGVVTWRALTLLASRDGGTGKPSIRSGFINFVKSVIGVLGLYGLFAVSGSFAVITVLLGGPVITIWTYTMIRESLTPFRALGRTFKLLNKNYGRAFSAFSILVLTSFLFITLLDTAISGFFFRVIGWVISFDQETMDQISVVLLTFLSHLGMYLVFAIILFGMGLLYYSLKEITDAAALKGHIEQIGGHRRLRGLDRE